MVGSGGKGKVRYGRKQWRRPLKLYVPAVGPAGTEEPIERGRVGTGRWIEDGEVLSRVKR